MRGIRIKGSPRLLADRSDVVASSTMRRSNMKVGSDAAEQLLLERAGRLIQYDGAVGRGRAKSCGGNL
jgi:hypothetical protein